MVDDEAITIRLTRDQAFVLSDWLYQVMFQSDDLEGIVHDRAVWSPIYAISGTLDKALSEIFMPDYAPRLDEAKKMTGTRHPQPSRPRVPACAPSGDRPRTACVHWT